VLERDGRDARERAVAFRDADGGRARPRRLTREPGRVVARREQPRLDADVAGRGGELIGAGGLPA
jgi:hypothetical protein